jgi:hypothetical protein
MFGIKIEIGEIFGRPDRLALIMDTDFFIINLNRLYVLTLFRTVLAPVVVVVWNAYSWRDCWLEGVTGSRWCWKGTHTQKYKTLVGHIQKNEPSCALPRPAITFFSSTRFRLYLPPSTHPHHHVHSSNYQFCTTTLSP